MIGYLEGVVRARRGTGIVVLVNGVGYKVALTKETFSRFPLESTISLFIYTAVREDALDLFGFETEEALRFFELLLTVSGIGPKSALAVLDMAPTETLRGAIAGGNAAYLTSVSGIGKKTAEKIVLELRDKVGMPASGTGVIRDDEEALEALKTLGYSLSEARDALHHVPDHVKKSSDKLRAALQILGGARYTS